MHKMIAYFGVLFLTCVGVNAPLKATPAQILMIRNAEFDVGGNLNQKGRARAQALIPYFIESPDLTAFGLPFAIFAARPSLNVPPFAPDDANTRCIDTVAPLAATLRKVLHSPFTKFEEQQLANLILSNANYDG